jgi:hypothetical protein
VWPIPAEVDVSTLANLINALAVTAGVIFAATQIRDYRRQRRRDSMLSLVRSFQSPTFAKGLRAVIELPDHANADEIREILGPDGEDLVVHVTATWETIGVLLFHGELTIDIIDDFFSGPILISWRKLLPYTTDVRQRYNRDTWSEWFQWLAERMMERESKMPVVPAYIAHAPGSKSYKRWLRRP